MSRRVVLTGLACLSAAGTEPQDLRRALRARAPLGRMERIDLGRGEWVDAAVARVAEFDRETYLPPARRRRMNRISQDWVIACLKARADAGLPETAAPERTGVCMGTGLGCLASTAEYLEALRHDGLGLGNPFLFSESVANAPAGHAAIELGCKGLNLTLTCGDASGVAAIELAARAIREGRADAVYSGGVEEMPEALLAVLARLGTLPVAARSPGLRLRAPRPRGGGSLPGEGTACLVLEEWERARRRGAVPYAEIRAGALRSDPEAGEICWSASARVRSEVLRAALRSSGLGPPDIDGAVLHESGNPAADSAEREAIRQTLLLERPPAAAALPAASPPRVTGQFAAAGAFCVAAAALSIRHQEFYDAAGPPAAGEGPLHGERFRHLLVSAASWGGSCMGLVLSRPGP